jgi:hypothetical protein
MSYARTKHQGQARVCDNFVGQSDKSCHIDSTRDTLEE